jgi:hypothetical protein
MTNPKESKMTAQERREALVEAFARLAGRNVATFGIPAAAVDLANLLEPDEEPLAGDTPRSILFTDGDSLMWKGKPTTVRDFTDHVLGVEAEIATLTKERDRAHRDLNQIAASLSEYERVEAIGMQSATMPDKIDALLRDLVRLRKMDRKELAASFEVDRLTKVNENLRDALTGIAGRADKALSE